MKPEWTDEERSMFERPTDELERAMLWLKVACVCQVAATVGLVAAVIWKSLP